MNPTAEQVWVVPRASLEALVGRDPGFWRGDVAGIIARCERLGFFMPRPVAEEDESHLQIIPYVLLRRPGRWFMVTRLATQGEARLHGKVSLGIGGHINPTEVADPFWGGVRREMAEEVGLGGAAADFEPLGVILDDSTPVSRVHCGIALGHTPPDGIRVRIAETDKMEGRWASLEEIRDARARMETWSQLLADACILSRAPH